MADRRAPPRAGRVDAPVGAAVTIHWDTWGVAHVRAQTSRDAFLGLGYAMAQERLWQLDYMRRQARGELAAVLGPASLPHDRAMRTLGIGPTADRDAAQMASALGERRAAQPAPSAAGPGADQRLAEVAEALDGLAAGINLWTERVRRLPVEFDLLAYQPAPWRPADSIAVWKYRWWTLTGRLDNVALAEAARRLLPPALENAFMATELGAEAIVPEGDRSAPGSGALDGGRSGATGHDSGEGSNNWVVGPSKSTTGKPVLCSDPHQPFGVPGQWFEAQLTVPGAAGSREAGVDAIGAVYVGTPGVYLGRNRDCAWGVTNHVAPARDVYIEQVEGDRYQDGGAWRPLARRDETIAVAGAAPERIVVRSTARGPLISDCPGLLPDLSSVDASLAAGHYALAWVGHRVGTGFDAMLALHRARGADDVLRALALWPCPPLNFVYADAAGRFGYHVAGHIPRRAAGGRGLRRADDPGGAWRGDLRFDELPRLADPERGWVATANNPPWAATHPHYVSLAAWADGYRMARIRERLTERETLTPDQVAAVQADVYAIRARDLVPPLLDLLAGSRDRRVRAALARLRGWDHEYRVDSVAASIFAAFWDAWRAAVARARFPEPLVRLAAAQAGALARAILLGEERGWFEGEVASHAERALARGLDRLTELAGPRASGWRWGRLHTIELRHPLAGWPGSPRLNIGPAPTSGGQTVRAAGYGAGGFAESGPFHAVSGSIYRLVVDFAQPGRARATTTVGQSGHPTSRHYRDQTPLWLADGYKPLWMDEADVLANLEGTTTLGPG